jgi:acetylornithine deacetylase/succinyl-diaminopimelate desuccinylase-like protein
MTTSARDDYLQAHGQQFEEQWCDWLRIASISADPSYRDEMRRAADWVAQRLKALGLASRLIETPGNPLVYAESPQNSGKPTVLVYGHYDVQPAVPLDRWISPPFEPTRRDGKLFARGATDDKGQVLSHVFGAQTWLEVEGSLPVNLKFLIEGEEEVGSDSLNEFLPSHADQLACDCVVISDGSQFAPGQPAITYGLRGIACFELLLNGPNHDLHSGSFGGSITNPVNALATMLSALVDGHGRIQVPGFYDAVVPLSPQEREQFARFPFDEKHYFAQVGVTAAVGEEGFTSLERRWARPTFDINGIYGGYQGKGAKTVLPAEAGAKFSFRLVPNQDPAEISRALETMLRELCPPGITMTLTSQHGAPGVLVPLDSPYVQAAARAIEHAFGRPPVFTREGGSIPIVTAFHQTLGADALLIGWGQDDDNAHSPNEKFSIADFHRGIRASVKLWEELGRIGVAK